MNDVIDIVINYFKGFDMVTINRLFTELLSDRALYDDSCNSCLTKLINMGATINTESYPRIIASPKHMFWNYIFNYGFDFIVR
uniref:Uncharacterized protein n=1 Tax=viral metagenome TaxID=1070528 RepID=A0A6C0CCJ8_9ZZZZ